MLDTSVLSLLDRHLAQAVCGLEGGADARDVLDAVRQQLRLVRMGSIGRVKLHVIIGRNSDGWKKDTSFKPLEALSAGAESVILEALSLLSVAWSITRPGHGLPSSFCVRLGAFILLAIKTALRGAPSARTMSRS